MKQYTHAHAFKQVVIYKVFVLLWRIVVGELVAVCLWGENGMGRIKNGYTLT